MDISTIFTINFPLSLVTKREPIVVCRLTHVVPFPCGGGVEYLHRSPASRRRRRKGSLESETVKHGHESHGTQT
jgi:hypothetical protein